MLETKVAKRLITSTTCMNINHIMEEQNVSIKDLSIKTGLAFDTLHTIIVGKANATGYILYQIAVALNVNLSDLFIGL